VPGGGTASFKCDNLSLSPSTSGKAKPSGAVGGLTVLDWAGFKGAVSFTFDDGNSSLISNYAKLKATGAHVTFFLVTSWTGASNAIWKTAVADGHEIGNHTKSHSSSGNASDLQAAEEWIKQNLGVTAYSMAAPEGNSSWSSVASSVVLLNRGVSDGLIAPRDSSNQYSLPAYLPPEGAASSAMDGAVNLASSGGKWKIFCVHGFTGDGSAYHPVDVNNMTTTMSNAVKNGVWTETMTNVGAYWLGQKLIPKEATTSATWTLPAHFPPNMCLRITTTGGTVKQNGAEVPWNEHGYYEISLDAKSVTIQ
jgi:peptidoglycan/xylan/chitin deacetylase (PgdA/CDA1 family)